MLCYKGLNITYAKMIFPLPNVYHIAVGIKSIIKTYGVRLRMEDSFRTQMSRERRSLPVYQLSKKFTVWNAPNMRF